MDIIWTVLSSLNFESTTFFCQIILFFVLHYSLKFLVYTPIMEIRDRRDKRIASNLATAEAAAETARRLKEEYEERVRSARAQGQATLLEATVSAEAQRKTRVEQAREAAGKILEEAKAQATSLRDQAEQTIESQAETVAKAIASRLVSSSLDKPEAAPVLAKIGGDR